MYQSWNIETNYAGHPYIRPTNSRGKERRCCERTDILYQNEQNRQVNHKTTSVRQTKPDCHISGGVILTTQPLPREQRWWIKATHWTWKRIRFYCRNVLTHDARLKKYTWGKSTSHPWLLSHPWRLFLSTWDPGLVPRRARTFGDGGEQRVQWPARNLTLFSWNCPYIL